MKYDRKLLIAIGRSRKAAKWQNKEMLWSEFLDKLATTTRTRETAAEYAALPKGERDTIKDVGGFVGGYLKNGKRNNASVGNRCMLCLDADNADPGLMDDLDMTFINAYALYSTHSHTPEKMRLRLIVPLSRTVTPDEYAAISRRIADELTLSRFDPTTFEPARLMYWPSAPEDGEYLIRCADEPFLDPDAVLATYPDWTDASLWPTTQPVEAKMRRTVSRQEDPLTKRGIIGAFCRAHSITDILENVLSDRYTSTTLDDRYTFVGGSTTGGLVVYDDKYAFSHHATDPAGGKLCNAVDLVRWHLFTPGGTAPDGAHVGDGKDSVRRMQEYAAQDEATRRTRCEERREQAAQEFGDLDAQEAQPAQDENWQEKLEVDKQGRVKDTLGNLALILRNDPRLRDIAYKAIYTRDILTKKNDREPTVDEIAKELELPKEDIVTALDAIATPMSLFEPVYQEGQDVLYLMEKYKDMVRKQARAMYLWGGENDDLIQEGMIGLFKAVQDYDPKEGASFSSFAGLCVSRQMYTAIKASQRKKHLPLNSYVSIYASASDNPEENGLSIVDTIEAGKESNPELMILGEEYTNAFEEELKEKLSKLERKVLYLHLQGMEYLKIAEFMDKSPKTIDNALQRIKAKARQLLEEKRRSEKK